MTTMTPIAQLPAPARASAVARRPKPHLTRPQKAAIIVQFILNEGADVALASLPDAMQSDLTQQLGTMRYVDRDTLAEVVREFADELEAVGISFPGDIGGALDALDGKISAHTARRLRKEAGVRQMGDPWARINALEVKKLIKIVEGESTQVAAVLMSKIDVTKAAEILGKLPGDKARLITYAVSMTGNVTPEAVDRIGISIATQLESQPPRAFESPPQNRLGEILNMSPAGTRDALLTGLDETDSIFADEVRKSIFTFANIPERIAGRDIPRVVRDVEPAALTAALAYGKQAGDAEIVEFILTNMSKRLAEGLREEMSEAGTIKPKVGEEAQSAMTLAIRNLVEAQEITLVVAEDVED